MSKNKAKQRKNTIHSSDGKRERARDRKNTCSEIKRNDMAQSHQAIIITIIIYMWLMAERIKMPILKCMRRIILDGHNVKSNLFSHDNSNKIGLLDDNQVLFLIYFEIEKEPKKREKHERTLQIRRYSKPTICNGAQK